MTSVRIHILARTGQGEVSFSYSPAVVEIVKTIPSRARRWDRARKVWSLDASYVPVLAELLEHSGHRVILTGATNVPPPRAAPAGDSWADLLLDAVGPQRIAQVHKALTRVLHPDLTVGDTALMQQLNAARDRRADRR